MAGSKPEKRAFHQALASLKEGEGVVMGVVTSRTAVGSVGVDFSNAPVPDRRFSVDGAWTSVGSDVVRVLFAQFKGLGPQIEHAIVMRAPFYAVKLFLDSMVRVAESARAYLGRVDATRTPEMDRTSLPSQTFTFDANVIIAGFSGREACLDLYYCSPMAKAALVRGGTELRGDPVARVMLTTQLMLEIHDELNAARNRLPSDEGDTVNAEVEEHG